MARRTNEVISGELVALEVYLCKPRSANEIQEKFGWSNATTLRRLSRLDYVWRCMRQGGQKSFYVSQPTWRNVEKNYTRRRRGAKHQ